MKSDILSERELRRYQNQIKLPSIGLEGQELIKQASVLVVGAGGKGTSVLRNLITGGIGKIGISDNYLVEEPILANQSLYGNSDIGKLKAIITRQKLKEINHFTEIELHNVCLADNNILSIYEGYEIIVDATNNYPAHCLINDAAIISDKPVVYGEIHNYIGQITVFNYKECPTYRCLYPAKPKKMESDNKNISSSGTLYNMVGSIMANEVFKLILSLDNYLCGELWQFDIRDYSTTYQKIVSNPKNKRIKTL
jgi:adenylyltransferase/sulfurtransferase